MMSVEELERYLELLGSAEYVRGVGYVVVVDGEQQVLDAETLKARQRDAEAQLKALAGPNAAQRFIRGLVKSQDELAKRRRAVELGAGQAKLAKSYQDVVANYRKAEFELADTARLVQKGAANRKPEDLAKFEERLSVAEAALNRAGLFADEKGNIVREVKGRSQVVAPSTRPPVAARPAVTPAAGAAPAEMVEDRLARRQAPTTTTPAGVTPAGTAPTVPTVPTGGGTPGAAGAAPARKPRREVGMGKLAEVVDQFFPGYTAEWLSENGVAHFGQDLIDLFRRVAAPGSVYDLTTEQGRERVRREIRQTNYWQTTLTAAKNFDQLTEIDRVNTIERTKQRLAATYGDISLDEDTLNELAQVVARNGLSGLGEQQAVYNTVFRVRAERPEQARRTLEGAAADRIRALGRAYNYKVSDAQIEAILTGTPEAATGLVLTEDGLRQRLQKYVKGAMPQLADQIDAGLSLEDIGANYRRYAANLLEKSEDEIDMFSGPYLEAFGSKDSGQLSLGEWVSKVKSDSRFGWQFTNQANRQAGDIALTIARAFGKVR